PGMWTRAIVGVHGARTDRAAHRCGGIDVTRIDRCPCVADGPAGRQRDLCKIAVIHRDIVARIAAAVFECPGWTGVPVCPVVEHDALDLIGAVIAFCDAPEVRVVIAASLEVALESDSRGAHLDRPAGAVDPRPHEDSGGSHWQRSR